MTLSWPLCTKNSSTAFSLAPKAFASSWWRLAPVKQGVQASFRAQAIHTRAVALLHGQQEVAVSVGARCEVAFGRAAAGLPGQLSAVDRRTMFGEAPPILILPAGVARSSDHATSAVCAPVSLCAEERADVRARITDVPLLFYLAQLDRFLLGSALALPKDVDQFIVVFLGWLLMVESTGFEL